MIATRRMPHVLAGCLTRFAAPEMRRRGAADDDSGPNAEPESEAEVEAAVAAADGRRDANAAPDAGSQPDAGEEAGASIVADIAVDAARAARGPASTRQVDAETNAARGGTPAIMRMAAAFR
jgi:hypothetical protein